MPKFLALYMGDPPGSPERPQPDMETIGKGMAAWGAWGEEHAAVTLEGGGPLGATKRIGPDGVTDITNAVAGYVIVEAPSHQAAAEMFLNHPHFAIFPGAAVEIMPVMPIPTAP